MNFLVWVRKDNDQSPQMMVVQAVRGTVVDCVGLVGPRTNGDRRIYSPVTSLWHHFIVEVLSILSIVFAYVKYILNCFILVRGY